MQAEQQAIYDATLTYLQKNLPSDFYAEDFSKEQSEELNNKLLTLVDQQAISTNKEYIRKAFLDFFSSNNYELIVIFKNENLIILKEKATIQQKEYSRVMQKINVCISQESESLEDCWRQEDVLVVNNAIMDKIYVHTEGLSTGLTRDLIKKSFRHTLKLHTRDAIFFMSRKVVVKKFIQKKKEERTNKRFGGIPPEELEKIKAQYFAQSLWIQIEPRVDDLLDNELNFENISNEFFTANYIRYLQDVFIDIVSATMQEEDPVIESFANFLLREHFDAILLIIAKRLAFQASKREGDAEGFLRYYNGDTILNKDGKPLIKPDLIDENHNRWNALTVMSVTMQYYNTLKKIKLSEEQLEPYRVELDEHDKEHDDLKQEIENLSDEKDNFESESQDYFKKTEEKKDELKELKLQESRESENVPAALKERINQISAELKRSYREEEKIFNGRKELENRISALNTKISNHKTERKNILKRYEGSKKKLESLNDEFNPVKDKYDLAMSTLAKTLSKKPKPA